MEQEIAVENIIRTKNLPECLVIITDSSVTVTVDEQELKQNVVAKICNVVMEETGRVSGQNRDPEPLLMRRMPVPQRWFR